MLQLIRITLATLCLFTLALFGLYLYTVPRLPDVELLREVELETPLLIYSKEGLLIGEFGEQRRSPLTYEEIPQRFIQAILAAEDDQFFSHPGINPGSLLRAALELIQSGRIKSGGSTITMQVAKNYFLSQERTFDRKLKEILLAIKIERELSKQEILALYVNKIYLGNRAYGIQAAAEVYYGKKIDALDLSEIAMIAALPKAPSRFNPIADPERAGLRRNWILGRMLSLGYIDQAEHDAAITVPPATHYHGPQRDLRAEHVAEMARQEILARYGSKAYSSGLQVITTLDARLQQSANQATLSGVLKYDRRHGYRGSEGQIDLKEVTSRDARLARIMALPAFSGLQRALITRIDGKQIDILLENGEELSLPWDKLLGWSGRKISQVALPRNPKPGKHPFSPGDLIRLFREQDGSWILAQPPQVQTALLCIDANSGAIQALVGGLNAESNHFNRVTQGERQPGSSFKPFIYSAALENGFTAASIIDDAPLVFQTSPFEPEWRPENAGGDFSGPIRLRQALYLSKNLVSIRLLQAIGPDKAISYAQQFGFAKERLPRDLTLALGTGTVTPLEMTRGYTVLANGGFKVEPYLIEAVYDRYGQELYRANPARVCHECDTENPAPEHPAAIDGSAASKSAPRVMDARTQYLINDMLKDVITKGTGRAALALNRHDIAGKTGTTNEGKDAWFAGFNPNLVTTVWVGYDQPRSLGEYEFGGTAALPIWIDFMRTALDGVDEVQLPQPPGIVAVRIDPVTGERAGPDMSHAIFELFKAEELPQQETRSPPSSSPEGAAPSPTDSRELF